MSPPAPSGDHHHGEAETAIYVVSGTPVFVFADGDQEVRLEAEPGDYIFVPPYVPHREENPGAGEAVVVIARSSQEAHRGQPAEPAGPAQPPQGPVRALERTAPPPRRLGRGGGFRFCRRGATSPFLQLTDRPL